jgi:hypothetical protein
VKDGEKTDLPPLADRRPKPRKRVLFGGVVVYGQGTYSCACKIRDLTTDGARILLPAGQPLPADLYLINLRSQTGHKANVIWHQGTEAGLTFLSTFNLHALEDPSLAYLKRIWLAHT